MNLTTPIRAEDAERSLAREILQRRSEVATVVQDIALLLQQSDRNLARVRDQAWYQRIWVTITRSNKRLAEENAANLREVQASALRLLGALAEMDELVG